MRWSSVLGLVLLVLAVFAAKQWRSPNTPGSEAPHPPARKIATTLEPSPVCPWREPAKDLLALFPPATNYLIESRVLSSATSELRKRLGRHLSPDENPLRIHRVQHEGTRLGSVLVTRVKGEYGGIELVTALEPDGTVRGVVIQSQREPEVIAEVITSRAFCRAFVGKSAAAPLRLGEDLPDVPAAARATAQAIADGVRSQLIDFSFAETRP